MQERKPPVNVGDEFDVRVEAVGEKGDGIAKRKGFVLFIPGVKEGERIKVRVTKVLTKVGFAEKIGEASKAEEPVEGEVVQPDAPTAYEDTEDFGDEPEEATAEEPAEKPATCPTCGGLAEEGHVCPSDAPIEDEIGEPPAPPEDDLDKDIPPPQ